MKKRGVSPFLFTNLFHDRIQREENEYQMNEQIGINSSAIVAEAISPLHSIGKMTALASTDGMTIDIALITACESLAYLSLTLKRDGAQRDSLNAGWS